MKKSILFFAIIPLLFAGCSKDPVSRFVVDETELGIGETFYFTNRSIDAESFEWDFGDGFIANSFNASHYYDSDGTYTVSLKAFFKGRIDISYTTIQVLGASLQITVKEYYEPNYLVPDISVRLYASVNDWEDEHNMVAEGFTSSSGVIRFDHLARQRYYVDIWGPHHDNYQLAAEDVGFIETPVLEPGEIKYWTAKVDYYPDGKKSSFDRASARSLMKTWTNQGTPRKAGERTK
jgi:PKD repeat protein